ncbi:MAG: thioesterase family protein [bacterium]|nr:thioesterase family protein [bacterium]
MSDSLSQCSTRIKFKIRYSETDQMGVANHARYFDWFSEGRVAWLEERGERYSDWEMKGWVLPVINAECKYIKSLRFQEVVELNTQVTKFNSRKVEFSYKILKPSQNLTVATGRTTHVFMHNVKIRQLKPEYYEVFSRTPTRLYS